MSGPENQPGEHAPDSSVTADQRWSDSVAESVISAYYPDAVRAGGAARQRAQAAHGILSAIVGATVGLTLASLDQEDTWIVVLGIAALVLWSAATALFVRAIGTTVAPDRHLTEVHGRDAFIHEVLRRASYERDRVARVYSAASVLALLAFAATCAFWASAALSEAPLDIRGESQVVIAERAKEALELICPLVNRSDIIPVSRIVLGAAPKLTIDADSCGGRRDVVISVDAQEVLMIAEPR